MLENETCYEVHMPGALLPVKFLTMRQARTHAKRKTTPNNPCVVFEVQRTIVIDHREETTT